MNYWLIKSDPETYSFELMKKEKKTFWNNYLAGFICEPSLVQWALGHNLQAGPAK